MNKTLAPQKYVLGFRSNIKWPRAEGGREAFGLVLEERFSFLLLVLVVLFEFPHTLERIW